MHRNTRRLSRRRRLGWQFILGWQELSSSLANRSCGLWTELRLVFLVQLGILCRINFQPLLPVVVPLLQLLLALSKSSVDFLWDHEMLIRMLSMGDFDAANVFRPKSCTMCRSQTCILTSESNDRLDANEYRFAAGGITSLIEDVTQHCGVVGTALEDLVDLPALCSQLGGCVVRECEVDVAIDCDRVVVIDEDEVVQLQVTGERDCCGVDVGPESESVVSLTV